MGFDDIGELAAAARARNEERKAAKNAALTAPLQERIAELEGLLDEAVKRGDALAASLEEAEAHVKTLQSQLAAFERAGKAAPASAPAKKRGK